MIDTLHLLHHTHTDYGYTDHPSIASHLFSRYTDQALKLIETHRDEPDEAARFRWNIEVAEVALRYWQQASDAMRMWMRDLVKTGLLDVGAMPFHPHGFSGTAEWDAIERRLAPIWRELRPATAIINDINGLAWGLVPRLLDSGIRYLSCGLNTTGGRAPIDLPRPGLFKWQGPDDRWIWVWNSLHYCDGYFFFHTDDWRRGPIPESHDVFFHPPQTGDIWRTDARGLVDARTVLEKRLAEMPAYPYRHLGLQVTNLWRMDNDPPSDLLTDFVRAWNRANFRPRLRISTFTQFLDAITAEEEAQNVPLVRGDWTNFWADGVAALPRENEAIAKAVEILSDLPELARQLGAPDALDDKRFARAWHDVSMFNEHTTDAHDSVSDPSGDLSRGAKAHKSSRAYEALAAARLATSDIIRASSSYQPGRHATGVQVVNPSSHSRSGWIELPLQALPAGTAGLIDETTGESIPVQTVVEPVWSEPRVDADTPFERPRDTFSAFPRKLKAFVHDLPPEGRRTLRFSPSSCATIDDRGCTWQWDAKRGRLLSLVLGEGSENCILPAAPNRPQFGQVLFDTYHEPGARWSLVFGDRANPPPETQRTRSSAVVEHFEPIQHPSFDQVNLVLRHPHCHRIEQRWLRHRSLKRIEIETDLWLKEVIEPTVGALCFPFAMHGAELWYTSLDHPTQVGKDQLPGACGAYTLTESAVGLIGDESLVLSSPGSALMAFGELDIFSAAVPRYPVDPVVFSIFACTRWMTNFSHLQPGRIRLRHCIEVSSPDAARHARAPGALYAVPII